MRASAVHAPRSDRVLCGPLLPNLAFPELASPRMPDGAPSSSDTADGAATVAQVSSDGGRKVRLDDRYRNPTCAVDSVSTQAGIGAVLLSALPNVHSSPAGRWLESLGRYGLDADALTDDLHIRRTAADVSGLAIDATAGAPGCGGHRQRKECCRKTQHASKFHSGCPSVRRTGSLRRLDFPLHRFVGTTPDRTPCRGRGLTGPGEGRHRLGNSARGCGRAAPGPVGPGPTSRDHRGRSCRGDLASGAARTSPGGASRRRRPTRTFHQAPAHRAALRETSATACLSLGVA